jgi:hypothetical protein
MAIPFVSKQRDSVADLDTVAHIERELAIGLAFPPELDVSWSVHWRSWMLDRRLLAVAKADLAELESRAVK